MHRNQWGEAPPGATGGRHQAAAPHCVSGLGCQQVGRVLVRMEREKNLGLGGCSQGKLLVVCLVFGDMSEEAAHKVRAHSDIYLD